MRLSIGLAVGSESVRAVLLRKGAVVGTAEMHGPGCDIGDTVRELLARAHLRSWMRPDLSVAVGPAFCQTRRIRRLPPMRDRSALDRIIAENVDRFFLLNGNPLLTGRCLPVGTGEAWAVAFDEPVIRLIEQACRSAGVRLRLIAPTLAILGFVFEDGPIRWIDGPIAIEVMLADGRLSSVNRVRPELASTEADRPPPRQALGRLGDAASRFGDAFGATLIGVNDGLTLTPRGAEGDGRTPPWRAAVSWTALGLAGVGAMIGPGLMADREASKAAERVASISDDRQTAAIAERELLRFNTALRELAAFNSSRTSATLLLSTVAEALPERSALVSFRMEAAGGSLIAVTPRASELLAALETAGITEPRIVGPVTRETVGEHQLERLTVQFRSIRQPQLPPESP